MKNLLSFFLLMVSALFVRAQTPGYALGDVVQDFSLKNVDGKWVSLADYPDAKGFIIVFTCNTCPVALDYQDRVMALNQTFAPQGYPLIAINPNDPDAQPDDRFELMQQRAREKHFDFPYLFDAGQHVTRAFGATRTPHIFVLEKTGNGNKVAYIGAIDNDPEEKKADRKTYVRDAITALRQGLRPEVPQTKAIGCTVKWKKH